MINRRVPWVILLTAVCAVGSWVDPVCAQVESDSSRVARLFMWASSGNVRFRDMVQPAKDSLGLMGADAARWLVHKLTATDARERHTLADIFEKIGPAATPYLIPYLDSAGEYMPKNAARALGRVKDTTAVAALLRQLDNVEYSVRSEVATSIGKLGDSRATSGLLERVEIEPDSDVRKSIAVAFGEIGASEAAAALIKLLGDDFFGVRQSAVAALGRLDPQPVAALQNAVKELDGVARHGAIVALGGCSGKEARKTLESLLRSDDAYARGYAVEGLGREHFDDSQKAVTKLQKEETDPFVLAQIVRYFQR